MTEQLWAPWRLPYILAAERHNGCIFCDFPAQAESCDEQNLLLYRGNTGFIILNAFPYSNGHLMVVPFRHTDTLETYGDNELLEIMSLQRLAFRLLRKVMNPEAFNGGLNIGRAAGAGITGHLHWHIVPRWNGDTNFMTVVNDVRVVPESLQAVYTRLKAALPEVLSEANNRLEINEKKS